MRIEAQPMNSFEYRGADRKGDARTGKLDASQLGDALHKRRRVGGAAKAVEPTDTTSDVEPLFPRRITRREVLAFTNELAVMVQTGITLSVAIENILGQADNPSLARVLRQLKAAVESGEDFSAALAVHPKLFDKTYVQLVKASEASGSLGNMLERLVDEGRRQMESTGKVRAALAYPAVMLVASIAASVFLLVYVFPKFVPLFAVRGITLPLPTRVMLAVSHFLTHRWYLALLGIAAVGGGIAWITRSTLGIRVGDRARLHLPILGGMFRQAAISRSLRTLATMLSSGVPMLQAIRLCGEVSGNSAYESDWNAVADAVSEGRQVHELIAASPRFPKSLAQMISAGEQTGRLSPILTKLSDHYDRELETAIKAATSLIEPIMVCFMGVVVGSVALALLLPIFTMSRHMG